MLKRKNKKIELMKERAELLDKEREFNTTPVFYNENNDVITEEIEVYDESNNEWGEKVLDHSINSHLSDKFFNYKYLVEDILNNYKEFLGIKKVKS